MKKVIFAVFCFVLLIGCIKADVVSETLLDACKSEGISCVSKAKDDVESLPNVYLFRGEGCTYCNRLITFLDSIIDNYDVNVVVYEVSNNVDNKNFYRKVGSLFDFNPSGYPYLVIGEDTFDGYSSEDDDNIKDSLLSLTMNDEPYDVVNYLNSSSSNTNDVAVIIIMLCFIIGFGAYLGFKIKSKN